MQYPFYNIHSRRAPGEVINKNSGRNRKTFAPVTYLSYNQGGYNLPELEMVYKLSKIKIAHHIATSTDQGIQLVREFQDSKEHCELTSANKVAQKHASVLGLEIEFNNPSTGTIIHTTEPRPHTYVVKSDKPSLLNIALHSAKKTSYEEKSRNNLGLESSLVTSTRSRACQGISVNLQKMEEHPRHCVFNK